MIFFKKLIREFIGIPAWIRLTEFKREFKVKNVCVHMDPSVYTLVNSLLPATGYYFDIGAHDGRTSSNTFHLESRGWGGILVEPMLPNYFKMLEYRNHSSNVFVNAACVSPEYSSKSIEMIYCDLMSFAPEISYVEFDDWKNGSQQFMKPFEEQLSVFAPVSTADQILSKSEAPDYIDFLTIDVEGAEMEVIAGLNLNKFSFGVVCIETNDEQSVLQKFSPYGYARIGYTNGNLILVLNKI